MLTGASMLQSPEPTRLARTKRKKYARRSTHSKVKVPRPGGHLGGVSGVLGSRPRRVRLLRRNRRHPIHGWRARFASGPIVVSTAAAPTTLADRRTVVSERSHRCQI